MTRRNFVPDRGDLVWITLSPVSGHEQAGRRPALVLSPKAYNQKTGLCLLCPATRQQKGYAFEVTTTGPDGRETVLLADHLRNVDWRARQAELMYRVTDAVVDAVTARIDALIISPDV
ncbi:MAG: endoribonuclease MazF [Planctomycetaceae bacterium]